MPDPGATVRHPRSSMLPEPQLGKKAASDALNSKGRRGSSRGRASGGGKSLAGRIGGGLGPVLAQASYGAGSSCGSGSDGDSFCGSGPDGGRSCASARSDEASDAITKANAAGHNM